MSTHAKIGTMKIGQNVTIPTKAWGTWTGEIIATRELGPYAAEGDFMVTIRDDNGTETEVRSNRKYSGYINTNSTEEEQSQTSDQATTDTTPASSRIASAQAEGNETATLALIDRPEDMHAIDAAWDAGARWARAEGGCYRLAMPGELETLAIVDPSDLTADLGSNLNRFR